MNPPDIKRSYKQGPVGPDAFYCDKCDLKLTSLTHASQHYSGKKHQMVVAKRCKPSGAGFYDNEGKWVRLSSKPQKTDRRFGIGEQFQCVPNDTVTTTTGDEYTNNSGTTDTTFKSLVSQPIVTKPPKISKVVESDPNLFCAVCKVGVTSALQMATHLSGSKHQKKLKASGTEITNTGHIPSSTTNLTINPIESIRDNLLNSVSVGKGSNTDLSMYRTPSGQYYCQGCNIRITNITALEQHLKGKRHLGANLKKKL